MRARVSETSARGEIMRTGMISRLAPFVMFLAALLWAAWNPADAFYQSRDSNYNVSIAGSTPFSIAYVSDNSNASGASSYTFTSQNIGTPGSTRIVVVGVFAQTTGCPETVSSVTIGGSSATEATSANGCDSIGGSFTDIWYLAVPTGAAATIVVNFSNSVNRAGIFVYNVFGTSSSFSAANNDASGTPGTSASATVTVPSGGGTVGVVTPHATGETISGSNLSMDVTGLVVGGSTYGAGHDTSHSGSTSFGFSWSPTSTQYSMSVAAFSP
jgi:hypothetical protein